MHTYFFNGLKKRFFNKFVISVEYFSMVYIFSVEVFQCNLALEFFNKIFYIFSIDL